MTAGRNSMRNTRRHNVDLPRHHRDHRFTKTQIHLPLKNDQCFVELMRLIRIGTAVHAQDLEVGASNLADND
ncbi:MAG: hypothetical protein RL297_2134 [Pseudomonadota bacterium]